ncbi:hypothetical protein TBLA_0I03510 [Henningerozyma blattae CBS 6284]|uniref:Uncharacterized protein n=1 Tax=Henningerozyma blattae (strain ATCC 34711 / CBS 6284 / DSM 70876 / NBRC 10599 / NRRL Y-10934 / UCD 77-7) TaxID=1071380 RepID=I2H9F2_HENB6|nr:hypothetical protein TBLA_0I03510 [Tetrapisispora blattae CBS 6284]CCH63004.1 hypothetical protein TBLA_0I03510 [Tetrapisispora blattae CBS 6284]
MTPILFRQWTVAAHDYSEDLHSELKKRGFVLNESIPLSKKSQRDLKYISTRNANICIKKNTERNIRTIIEPFILNIIKRSNMLHLSGGNGLIFKVVNCPDVDLNFTHTCLKDRLTLDTQVAESLRSCRSKMESNIKINKINPLKANATAKRFLIDTCSLPYLNKHHGYLIKFQLMPSEIENKFETFLNESLPKTLKFNLHIESQNRSYFKSFRNLQNFSIDRVNLSSNLFKTKPCIKFESWDVSCPQINLENYFWNQYSKLFDIKFNELELYKKPYERIRSSHRFKKFEKKTLKFKQKYWKLHKCTLKELNWKPFERIESLFIDYLETNDTIDFSIATINFHAPTIVFAKQHFSQLELIDLDTKTFKKFNTGVNFSTNKDHTNTANENIETCKLMPLQGTLKADTFIDNINNTNEINITLNDYYHDTSLLECTSESKKRRMNESSLLMDEDFKSILSLKKQKYDLNNISQDINDSKLSEFNILEILGNPIHDSARQRETVTKNIVKKLQTNKICYTNLNPLSQLLPITHDTNIILTNANRLKFNHEVISQIQNKTSIKVIEEFFIDSITCDFILNYSTCIYIIEIEKFFQMCGEDELYYELHIKRLLGEFKKIILLIKYTQDTEDFDNDIFWKVRLYLNFPLLDIYFVLHDDRSCASHWIIHLSRVYSANEKLTDASSLFIAILKNLGFNSLLIKKLSKEYQLYDFFGNIKTVNS